MNMIIISAAVIAVVGIVVGFGLGIIGEKFKVEIDEREAAIRAELPGNNCGGCGYPGCDGLAKAINEGKAPCNQCPVGGAPVGEKIAAIMGVTVEETAKKVAFVKCNGGCDKASQKDNYYGILDCSKAMNVPGGSDKACSYGCMGFGSCVRACEFDAIHVINGVAVVDKEKCVACGKCIAACPKKLIEFVPYDTHHFVRCNSQDKGKAVKEVCSVGCIGCTACVKNCPQNTISMNGNVAVIDYTNCVNCGVCAEKCPTKAIFAEE
jgi:Na+-translocating ferredoxin:NAD+ oxidoreductase subunit B